MKLKALSVAALIASSLAYSLPAYSWSGESDTHWQDSTNAISKAKNDDDIQFNVTRVRRAEQKIERDEKQLQQDVDALIKLNAKMYGMMSIFCESRPEECRLSAQASHSSWKKCRDGKCKNDTR